MNKIKLKKVQLFLYKLGYGKIKSFQVIKGGINSNVYKLKVGKIIIILKCYTDKNRLRIKREKIFYNYLNKIQNNKVLKPIGFNIRSNIALFPYINGNKIKKIENNHIKELLFFLKQINKKKTIKLPIAIDGIRDRKNHIKLCEKKINQIKKIKIDNILKKKMSNYLKERIIPKFTELKKYFLKKQLINLQKIKLLKKEMIVSPSDIGFHNIIKSKNNLFFYDFEYAGLDDPIKLICDFYCQPDQSLTVSQKRMFIENLSVKNQDIKQLKIYTKIFLPFHKLKWCCIILNKFIDNAKNIDKNLIKENNKILKKQLIKSIIYFNRNFKEFSHGN